ncbi:MAG: 50S ribosomal protein L23 [Candidatus Pacebacteria bacterium]|nr:50S ribosomal protein L23 [Candidatus Paceibacterota bacterium]
MAKELSQNEIQQATSNDTSRILGAPRVTEKAVMGTTNRVYTFNVALSANKIQIKQAIKSLYNVEPVKINTIRQRPIETRFRGRTGIAKAYKKAVVYLRKGDTIEL